MGNPYTHDGGSRIYHDIRLANHHFRAYQHDRCIKSVRRRQRFHTQDFPIAIGISHRTRHDMGKHHRHIRMPHPILLPSFPARPGNILRKYRAYRIAYRMVFADKHRHVTDFRVYAYRTLLSDKPYPSCQIHPVRIIRVGSIGLQALKTTR